MTVMRYTKDHEWVREEADGIWTVGITHFAQEQLGDIVYVELPAIGRRFGQGEDACVIESVKAAAELKQPLSGEVLATNDALAEHPELVNSDPCGAGWFLKIKPSAPAELDALMDEATYQTYLAG
ncbi:MAG: glycine cleavage system protein GcvH [Gammaproteobacteria bacterium]|nr:glycine cleavage system protein GcvH [Gammaproteobacteria bacterium]MBI5615667.1 glycine cleavage system protein GcvH [Gammaproteobacteria bacterium]